MGSRCCKASQGDCPAPGGRRRRRRVRRASQGAGPPAAAPGALLANPLSVAAATQPPVVPGCGAPIKASARGGRRGVFSLALTDWGGSASSGEDGAGDAAASLPAPAAGQQGAEGVGGGSGRLAPLSLFPEPSDRSPAMGRSGRESGSSSGSLGAAQPPEVNLMRDRRAGAAVAAVPVAGGTTNNKSPGSSGADSSCSRLGPETPAALSISGPSAPDAFGSLPHHQTRGSSKRPGRTRSSARSSSLQLAHDAPQAANLGGDLQRAPSFATFDSPFTRLHFTKRPSVAAAAPPNPVSSSACAATAAVVAAAAHNGAHFPTASSATLLGWGGGGAGVAEASDSAIERFAALLEAGVVDEWRSRATHFFATRSLTIDAIKTAVQLRRAAPHLRQSAAAAALHGAFPEAPPRVSREGTAATSVASLSLSSSPTIAALRAAVPAACPARGLGFPDSDCPAEQAALANELLLSTLVEGQPSCAEAGSTNSSCENAVNPRVDALLSRARQLKPQLPSTPAAAVIECSAPGNCAGELLPGLRLVADCAQVLDAVGGAASTSLPAFGVCDRAQLEHFLAGTPAREWEFVDVNCNLSPRTCYYPGTDIVLTVGDGMHTGALVELSLAFGGVASGSANATVPTHRLTLLVFDALPCDGSTSTTSMDTSKSASSRSKSSDRRGCGGSNGGGRRVILADAPAACCVPFAVAFMFDAHFRRAQSAVFVVGDTPRSRGCGIALLAAAYVMAVVHTGLLFAAGVTHALSIDHLGHPTPTPSGCAPLYLEPSRGSSRGSDIAEGDTWHRRRQEGAPRGSAWEASSSGALLSDSRASLFSRDHSWCERVLPLLSGVMLELVTQHCAPSVTSQEDSGGDCGGLEMRLNLAPLVAMWVANAAPSPANSVAASSTIFFLLRLFAPWALARAPRITSMRMKA